MAKLPGIGKRTALRFALHLLKQDEREIELLSESILKLGKQVKYCSSCFNLSEFEVCEICSNPKRNELALCIVEDIRDVMAIEKTGQFDGLYHVLGGRISPMEGIGPMDLKIQELIERLEDRPVKEIILALSTTMEGDTTNFYLYKKLSPFSINISSIARGVSLGDELEYADELTLGRSIINRIPYEQMMRTN